LQVVLDKLSQLQKSHPKVLQESLMDMLRVLASPNSDIRRKTLDICMDLVTPANVDEVVLVLKKEVVKTQAKDVDKDEAAEYRRMLVQAIHSCAVKFPGKKALARAAARMVCRARARADLFASSQASPRAWSTC
jgi:coatomer subunit beta